MSEPTGDETTPDPDSSNDDLHGAAADVQKAMDGKSDDEDAVPTPGNG